MRNKEQHEGKGKGWACNNHNMCNPSLHLSIMGFACYDCCMPFPCLCLVRSIYTLYEAIYTRVERFVRMRIKGGAPAYESRNGWGLYLHIISVCTRKHQVGQVQKQFSYKNDEACRDRNAKKYRNKEASRQQSRG